MQILTDHIETWAAVTVVALLGVFSDKILGGIRLRINRADLRVKYFEQLAVDLSAYIFWAEVYHEYFEKGWVETAGPEWMTGLAGELNSAMTTLRTKEYVYRSWVRKYWGTRGSVRFGEVLDAVKATDLATHAFNNEGQVAEKTATLGRELDRLRALSEHWLSETDA
jgi:hypothetical protein